MSDLRPITATELHDDIGAVAESLARYSQAVGHATGAHDLAIRKIWQDIAELRDELHAVSNRLENLTRAVTTSPAEVVERGFVRLADDLDTA